MVGVPNGGAKIRRKIGRCKSLVEADGILNCQVADNQCCISRPDGCRPLMFFVLRVSRLSSFVSLAFRPSCLSPFAPNARVRTLQPKRLKLVTPSTPDTDYQVVAAVGGRTSAHTNGRTKCRTKPFCQCFTPKARNVQASRENFTASHKILTAARKCFTVGHDPLVSPLVRL